ALEEAARLPACAVADETASAYLLLLGDEAPLPPLGRLYREDGIFRGALDSVSEATAAETTEDVRLAVLEGGKGGGAALRTLATFAGQMALGMAYLRRGLAARAIAGAGAGMYAAAHLAGALPLDLAVALAAQRAGCRQAG